MRRFITGRMIAAVAILIALLVVVSGPLRIISRALADRQPGITDATPKLHGAAIEMEISSHVLKRPRRVPKPAARANVAVFLAG